MYLINDNILKRINNIYIADIKDFTLLFNHYKLSFIIICLLIFIIMI